MSTALAELRQRNVASQRAARGEEPLPPPATQDPSISPAIDATGSAVAQTTSSATPYVAGPAGADVATYPNGESSQVEVAHSTGSLVAQTTSSVVALPSIDPVKAALASALAQPIPPVPEEGKPQMVVTTIKIRQEVWERMKYATQLSGKNQQVLVEEALRDLFARMTQKAQGE
jgi:subtilisin family serine protease